MNKYRHKVIFNNKLEYLIHYQLDNNCYIKDNKIYIIYNNKDNDNNISLNIIDNIINNNKKINLHELDLYLQFAKVDKELTCMEYISESKTKSGVIQSLKNSLTWYKKSENSKSVVIKFDTVSNKYIPKIQKY